MIVARAADEGVSRIAAAIGDPGRARILCRLMDGRARTATELAMIADVSPSTASVHLGRLTKERLLKMVRQGKHRYYALGGNDVAAVLERLLVLSGSAPAKFVASTPNGLCAARTCYDHIAGTLGVALHDRMLELDWFATEAAGDDTLYALRPHGEEALGSMGIDVQQLRTLRRRFASQCLDWSERRPHLGGAIGAALLAQALTRKWVTPELESRALSVTAFGRREMRKRFGVIV
jgi:DNA-binding transcriptional ArsR family regulator